MFGYSPCLILTTILYAIFYQPKNWAMTGKCLAYAWQHIVSTDARLKVSYVKSLLIVLRSDVQPTRRLSTHIGQTAAPPMAILLRSLSTWWEVYRQLQLHPFNSTFTITWYALTFVPPLHRLLTPLFAALNQIEAGNSTDDLKILGSWRRLPSVLYLSMRCCTFCRMHCVVWERSRDHAFLVLHPWTLVYTIMYDLNTYSPTLELPRVMFRWYLDTLSASCDVYTIMYDLNAWFRKSSSAITRVHGRAPITSKSK
jgi:hypothetical protein